jgi:hypothetical protein
MLNWEEIEHNHSFNLIRVRIPGGWLVSATEDVRSPMDTGYNKPEYYKGYEWRTSITFVPDPNHEWKIN